MNKPTPPEEPKFIQSIEATQKVFAGIAFTMFIVVWISGFDVIGNIFKPDFVIVLTIFRIVVMLIALSLSGFVGYKQGRNMVRWGVESYRLWQNVMEMKKQKEEK